MQNEKCRMNTARAAATKLNWPHKSRKEEKSLFYLSYLRQDVWDCPPSKGWQNAEESSKGGRIILFNN
jgi:hypothetical protein